MFWFQALQAQDSLCVFKTKGTILREYSSKKTALKKGDFITGKDKLFVSNNSQLIAISNQGDLFIVTKEGKYTFDKLLQFKQKKGDKDITSLYLKYLWSKITSHGEKKSIIAGAFRGNALMQYPKDSTITANSNITLQWKLNKPDSLYYVFIRNKKTKSMFKFESNGSHLVFEKDNPIFDGSTEFEWSVTTEAFPNVKNIPFYTFTLIDREKYEQQKKGYKDLIDELRVMEFNDDFIESVLCEYYKLCR